MSKIARRIIGNNVKNIRRELALSLLNFSILCEISKASVVNIETGKNGYNLNLLDKITTFTKYSLKELSDEKFIPKRDLRKELIKTYAKNNTFSKILNERPKLVYAITHYLLSDDFLDSPKQIKDIKEYLSKLGWSYGGVTISVTLKRLSNIIKIEPHPTKKGTFVYSKK